MSGGIEALQLKEEDVLKLLAAGVHLGASNVDYQMESYVYKRKPDGKNSQLNSSCDISKFLFSLRYIHTLEVQGSTLTLTRSPLESKIGLVESEKCQLRKNTCPIGKVIFYSLESSFWCSRLVEK